MNPLHTELIAALDPLHRAPAFLLLHADMAMVIRFYLLAALATVKLVIHY